MLYSAWGTEDGSEFTFIDGIEMRPDLVVNSPPHVLLKVFEADSYNDAMRQYHEWQGWEPYKPMDE